MCWYICSSTIFWTAIVSKWYLHLFWSDLNKIKQTNRWDQTPGLTLHTSPIKYVHEGHLSDQEHRCFRFLCWGHIVFQSRMCQDLLAEKCSTVSGFDIIPSYIVFFQDIHIILVHVLFVFCTAESFIYPDFFHCENIIVGADTLSWYWPNSAVVIVSSCYSLVCCCHMAHGAGGWLQIGGSSIVDTIAAICWHCMDMGGWGPHA